MQDKIADLETRIAVLEHTCKHLTDKLYDCYAKAGVSQEVAKKAFDLATQWIAVAQQAQNSNQYEEQDPWGLPEIPT